MRSLNPPKIIDEKLYQLLREERPKDFNQLKASGVTCDMSFCDFRSLDLRGIDASGLDWTGAYFRGADLRGLDLRFTKMEGSSICNAKISGVYFPKELDPMEIWLSLEQGTRMRYSSND
jgi:uncharacterized protein YjbI with pentapeptide repeats